MAHYTISHACGHDHVYNLFGKASDRDRKSEWLTGKVCPACQKADTLQARAVAAEAGKQLGEEMGLPALVGTEKQIAWAEQIRGGVIPALQKAQAKFEGLTPKNDQENGIKIAGLTLVNDLYGKTSASWWIDARDKLSFLPQEPVRWLAQQVQSAPPISLTKTIEDVAVEKVLEQDTKAQAEVEATVYPQTGQISGLVAVVTPLDGSVTVAYPDKSDKLRELVKELGFQWNWDAHIWVKKTPYKDLAVQVANKLLLAGFPIRLFDTDLRTRAISGDYQPEPTRFVRVYVEGEYKGWFAMMWARGEDYYAAAKRLPGARYSKPAVAVPPEAWVEVADFAAIHKFAINDRAKALLSEREQLSKSSIKAQVQAKKDAEVAPATNGPIKVEVPDDLKD
jgi:hypothetical protein